MGSLSSDVFERRASTGSGPFSLIICPDASKFVTLIEKICPNICSKSCLKSTKNPLPVDVRRSKTSFLNSQISLFSVLNIVYFRTDSLLVEKRNGWQRAIYVCGSNDFFFQGQSNSMTLVKRKYFLLYGF